MNRLSWECYQVPLVPPPPRASPVRVDRPAVEQLAGRGVRLIAVLLDTLIGLLPVVAGFLLLPESAEGPETRKIRFLLYVIGILTVVPLQFILLSLRGQTLGKLAVGVRIVCAEDGSNPGFLRAVVLRNIVPFLISLLPILGALFSLADILSIFGEERRCLHDLIANTKVVDVPSGDETWRA